MFKKFICNCIFFGFCFSNFYDTNAGTFSVDYSTHQFLKDGKPFKYISGSIHYFRVHPDLWDDRLKRIRAMGLNAIQIYAPWNLHEPTQGNFDFSGIVNITRFLELAQQNNLYVLLRPGPYIDAEWEQGGFPYWLLKYDNIKLRSSDSNYTNAVQIYFYQLLDVIKPYLYKNGGPILMLQVENEYGTMGACDQNYTLWLRDLIWDRLGNDVVLYTSMLIIIVFYHFLADVPKDGNLNCGKIPDTVTTVDFAPNTNHSLIDGYFNLQDTYSNGAPHVCSEFYTDWLLTWGENHGNFRPPETIVDNLSYLYHEKNASVNLYLVHGGTNLEFNNGAEYYAAVITSYWVGSPISENGNITDMYLAIRSYTQNLTDWEYPPTPIPSINPTANYGQVSMNRIGSNLISTLSLIQEPCTFSQTPLNFEQIDHGYGYVLYTTTLAQSGKLLLTPNIRDYGYVFLNNNYQGMIMRDGNTTLALNNANSGDILRILVENRGRRCGWSNFTYPLLDMKGLHDNVTLDGMVLENWYQCGINLTKSSIDSLTQSYLSEKLVENDLEKAASLPGVYMGQFDASVLQDTYFDSTGWGKGQLFINGYNMGRYWPTAGPQVKIYVFTK